MTEPQAPVMEAVKILSRSMLATDLRVVTGVGVDHDRL